MRGGTVACCGPGPRKSVLYGPCPSSGPRKSVLYGPCLSWYVGNCALLFDFMYRYIFFISAASGITSRPMISSGVIWSTPITQP